LSPRFLKSGDFGYKSVGAQLAERLSGGHRTGWTEHNLIVGWMEWGSQYLMQCKGSNCCIVKVYCILSRNLIWAKFVTSCWAPSRVGVPAMQSRLVRPSCRFQDAGTTAQQGTHLSFTSSFSKQRKMPQLLFVRTRTASTSRANSDPLFFWARLDKPHCTE